MTSRIILEPSFVLHSRNFSDTSSIIDFFTLHHGRITVLVRGVRTSRSKFRGILQPFVPLLISWSGKTDLPVLTNAESTNLGYNFSGKKLLSAIYINELLVRLLQRCDPHVNTFNAYTNALMSLQNDSETELSLRKFEAKFLADLGYGIQFDLDSNSQKVLADKLYIFEFGKGLIKISGSQNTEANIFLGKSLLAMQNMELVTVDDYFDAKRLMRLAIGALLGDRQLKSRELWRSYPKA